MEAVEPAPSLIYSFTDIVRREPSVFLLVNSLVFERVVPLGEGHCARVEPGVHHLWNAAHLPAAAIGRALQRHVVDVGPVQVKLFQAFPGLWQRLYREFGRAPDALSVTAVLALPDGYGCAPVPLPGYCPVDVVAQPLAKSAVLDVIGIPVDFIVAADQFVLEGRGSDIPGTLGVVEQRSVATPAEGVGVAVYVPPVQQPAVFEVFHDLRVGILHERARK